MHYLNTLLAFITHHPRLAYGAIFLISLSESLALVGLIVPGTLIMFGVGAIVATGSLGLKPVLLLADQAVYHFFQSLRTPWADRIFIAITELGDSFINICLSGKDKVLLIWEKAA